MNQTITNHKNPWITPSKSFKTLIEITIMPKKHRKLNKKEITFGDKTPKLSGVCLRLPPSP